MFIDTYSVRKQAILDNTTLSSEMETLLNEIDENQGTKSILQLSKTYPIHDRNTIWRLIQKVNKYFITVETTVYNLNGIAIAEKDVRKHIKSYDVFCLNFYNKQFLDNPDLFDLKAGVNTGNKLVIYAINVGD